MAKRENYDKRYYREHKERVERLALDLGKDPKHCSVCGKPSTGKRTLHWHHIDPTTKQFNLSQNQKWTDVQLVAELEKCIRICKSCHRHHHTLAGQGSVFAEANGIYHVRMTFSTQEQADAARALLIEYKGRLLENRG